ncbi:phage/plasmid primase, P4 family [Phenylobacterium sp.]|uniref:phage/plasmid primase, P4 family n=1 Tax=Phenylobacterium sp. TaxID=1871053 RepID=UPI0035B4AA48
MSPADCGALPDAMRAASRWLVWRQISQGDGKKPRKVPYYADGSPRSGKLDTPDDWAKLTTFEAALSALDGGSFAGLGFALGPDGSGQVWQGVDLDGLDARPALQEIAHRLPGYVETSPSGNGLHAIGHGCAFPALGSNASGIEAYSSGRFFTVTGARIGDGSPIDLAQFVDTELRPRHGSARHHAPALNTPTDGSNAVATPRVLADLRDALNYVDADDYGAWTSIGLALKTLGEAGRQLWHDWSATSPKYDEVEAQAKWRGFKPERTGYAAVFAEAQRNGWPNPAARRLGVPRASGHSEDELARAFAQENEASLRYCAAWGQWLAWDGVRWAPDRTLLATDYARDLCRRAAASTDDRSAALGRASTVSAVERLARADRKLAATVEQWDADPWLLNTPDGVVDLKTGEVSPCTPALHMTKVAGTAAGGNCPTWLRFLGRITADDTELQAYIQRVLGYTLSGDTSAHALFFGYGTGANGKSVLIDTVAGILGDYHKTAPIETFTESGGDRHPTELAMLRGARLVTAVETEEGRRWAESRIKTLTGGDRIAARFMRQDFFEYDPQFKLFVAGNHKPGLRSVDEAMRRRFHMIPFAVTIPPHERDPALKEKLRAEWPGILAWMIAGCLEWQRVGLAPPSSVRAATDAYLEAEDALAAWIDEACERDPQAWETSTALFSSWNSWADINGEHGGTVRRFIGALEGRGFLPRRKAQARGVLGLRLKERPLWE